MCIFCSIFPFALMYTSVTCTFKSRAEERAQAPTPSRKASCLDCGRSPGPSQWAPWRRPSLDHKPAADCTGPPALPSSPHPVQPISGRIAGTASAARHCSAAPGAAPDGQNSPEHTVMIMVVRLEGFMHLFALNNTWGKRRRCQFKGGNEGAQAFRETHGLSCYKN